MIKKRYFLLLFLVPILYLLFWPVPIRPQAWQPAPVPDQRFPVNDALSAVQRLATGVGTGPEGLAVDARGRIYAGYDDGRVMRFDADGRNGAELADTGGRPLGLSVGADGDVLVADARRGLLQIGADGAIRILATQAEGVPLKFVDDVDRSPGSPVVYFSDASSRFGLDMTEADVLEHGANGRLLAYDPVSDQTHVLLHDLYFANGVAVGPDSAYVLVSETSAYRIRRYWLKGDRAGTTDIFIDNLPGFPDNLSYNGGDRFWLALYAPRTRALDSLLPHPFLRSIAFRLPRFLQPRPVKHAWVLGLDLDGHVVADLQYVGDDAYAPITSAEQHGGELLLGSLTAPSIGRLPLADVGQTAIAPGG